MDLRTLHKLLTLIVFFSLAVSVSADEIILKNGDRISGTIVNQTDSAIVLQSAMLGELTISKENIQTFSVGNQQEPAKEAPAAKPAPKPAEKPKVDTEPKWTGDFTANFAAQRGNNDQDSINMRLAAKKKSDKDTIEAEARYRFEQQENTSSNKTETTDDNLRFAGKYSRKWNEKWYWYGKGSYEKDRIAELERRIIGGLGSGYQWVESDQFNFATELGLAGIHEKYTEQQGTSDEITLEAGYNMDAKINDKLTFAHRLTYYPSFEDIADYLLITDAELRYHFSEQIFASLRGEVEYDSTPAPGSEQTIQRYLVGLGWKF